MRGNPSVKKADVIALSSNSTKTEDIKASLGQRWNSE